MTLRTRILISVFAAVTFFSSLGGVSAPEVPAPTPAQRKPIGAHPAEAPDATAPRIIPSWKPIAPATPVAPAVQPSAAPAQAAPPAPPATPSHPAVAPVAAPTPQAAHAQAPQ